MSSFPTGKSRDESAAATVGRTAHVYCGNFVGAPHWHGLEFFEPDECDYEGDVPLPEAPEEDSLASWDCPGCGATNTVRDHESFA